MARALENPDIDPTYLDFFGMTRPPFAPLSVPSQIFHSEQYSLLMAHLASATKQADCLMVICGADGSGKTTLLNRYITSLSEETSFATFDETCSDGTEFYCAFLRQLGFHDITGKLRELRRITKEFLIHRGKAQDPVLLIMDNAHLVSPTVLEQLRWIAETKVEDRRVLSIVLAGNSDLPRIMDSPAMKLMKFRSHVDFTIRVFTEEETEDYVRHRLRLAGGVDSAKFASDSHPLIYRFSGGIPNAINTLCNEALTEACARETRVIRGELIRAVADRNRLEPSVIQYTGKGRRKTDPEYSVNVADQKEEERIAAREAPGKTANRASGRGDAAAAGDAAILKEHLARMQAQLVALKAENHQAQLDIGACSRDIAGLHEQLAAKTREAEDLQVEAGKSSELRQQLKVKTQEISSLEKTAAEVSSLREQLEAKTRQTEELGKTVAEIKELQKQLDKKSDENAALARAAGEVDGLQEELNARNQEVTRLREQLDAMTAEKVAFDKAQAEIGDLKKQIAAKARDADKLSSNENELAELRKQLEAKVRENKKLSDNVDKLGETIKQLEETVSGSEAALGESEKASKAIMRDLKAEKSVAQKALAVTEKAEKRVEKLDAMKSELQQSVRKLNADLKRVNKQNKDNRPLKKKIRTLEQNLKEKTELLESGDELVSKLENSLQEARAECEELRSGDDALQELQASVAEKDARIAYLEAELASYSHLITTTQPALDEEKIDADTAPPDPGPADASAEPTITSIQIFKDGQVEDVLNIKKLPARVMIGRGDDCELHLNSKFVSRHHALIFCQGDGIYIEDLNSFNGTVVNYKKILRCELHPDDRVVVGDYELRPS